MTKDEVAQMYSESAVFRTKFDESKAVALEEKSLDAREGDVTACIRQGMRTEMWVAPSGLRKVSGTN